MTVVFAWVSCGRKETLMTKLTMPMEVYPLKETDDWKSRTGDLPVKMTNDYLFRALMQSDERVRNALIASLLGIPVEEVTDTRVENPILLGTAIDEKYYFLDVLVSIRDEANLNLEMQVVDEHNWPERSLGYLCRLYDRLNRGDSYEEMKAAIQVGILDFTLFKDAPSFFSEYKLMEPETGKVYTEKFRLAVFDLTQIGLATDRDKKQKLDSWARLFKAKTWEEVIMVAHEDKVIERAVSGVFQLTEDERLREQCRQREEYNLMREMERRRVKRYEEKIESQEAELKNISIELTGKVKELAGTKEELADTRKELVSKDKELESKDKELGEARDEIESLKAEIVRLSGRAK